MDDYQNPEDVPEPVGPARSRDGKPKQVGEHRGDDDSGPEATEAPEEEGSASSG